MKLSRRALWVAGGLVAGLVAGASFLAFAQRGPGWGRALRDAVKGGQVQRMLSVHDLSGEVWYHAWHGRSLGEDSLQDKPV